MIGIRDRARADATRILYGRRAAPVAKAKRLPFLVVNMVDVKNGKAHPRQRMGLGSHNQCAQCGSVLCLVLGLVNLTVATPYTATDLYGLLSLSCARTGKF